MLERLWRTGNLPTLSGGHVSWCSHCVRVLRFLRKLTIELPYDPAIPLLDINLDKTIIQKDTCTPMFTATLFTSQDMETT